MGPFTGTVFVLGAPKCNKELSRATHPPLTGVTGAERVQYCGLVRTHDASNSFSSESLSQTQT